MMLKIIRITILSILFLFAISDFAGAQLTRIGGGLSFSTGVDNETHKTGNPGINARGVVELGDKFWIVPELAFYLPGKRQYSTTLFGTVDINATYALATEKSILFYALAGGNLSYLRSKFDSGDKPSTLMPALNIGTGIEMIVEKDLNGFAQIKGVIGSYQPYIAISIGVNYYITGRRYKSW